MSNMSRREFLRFSTFAAVGLLAASCRPAPAPAAEPTEAVQAQATTPPQPTAAPAGAGVKITYWHGWTVDSEKATMEAAVKLFADAHPSIQVEAVCCKTNDQVLTAISAGNPPDSWSVWGTQTLAQWAATGVLMNLDELVSATGLDESAFFSAALGTAKYQGKWFGLPMVIDAMAVYYNKGLFKEAGLDPEAPPKTMEELLQMAEKLTKLDDAGNISQLGFTGWGFSEAVAYMYGGRWWDPASGKPSANDPGNVAAWTAMASYFKKFGAEKINTFNSQQANNPLGSLFLVGKVAMALDGDWVTLYVPRFAPNMEWGLFPLPPAAGKAEAAFRTPIDGAIYSIPTGAKNAKEAWEFVRWLGTSKEASCVLQKGWANASALKAVAADAGCLPCKEFQVYLDIMAHNKMEVWPPIAVSSSYANARNAAADSVNYGQKTPQQALDELQQKIQEELQKATS